MSPSFSIENGLKSSPLLFNFTLEYIRKVQDIGYEWHPTGIGKCR